jgi:hypothetical protein
MISNPRKCYKAETANTAMCAARHKDLQASQLVQRLSSKNMEIMNVFLKTFDKINATNITMHPRPKQTRAQPPTRRNNHAPCPWHSCRRRHPAAAARSPRDHFQSHESAPCIRSARACVRQTCTPNRTRIAARTEQECPCTEHRRMHSAM